METERNDEDLPDEIDRAAETGQPEFGEHDEQAQEAEWAEDAQEGGSSD